jgi:hypothetical protein
VRGNQRNELVKGRDSHPARLVDLTVNQQQAR